MSTRGCGVVVMAKAYPFVVVRRGNTPEEAFEKAKLDGFANDVRDKDYMVYLDSPKRKRPFKYVQELLDTNVILQNPNGPVGCLLARPAGWVSEEHVVGRTPKTEIIYVVIDNENNELFTCFNEKQAVKRACQWTSEHKTKVSIQKQIRIVESVVQCQAVPDNHLNAYWFFGWAIA